MAEGSEFIEIAVRQIDSGGLVDGTIQVQIKAIDWYGTIGERTLISVRGERFTLKDPEALKGALTAR